MRFTKEQVVAAARTATIPRWVEPTTHIVKGHLMNDRKLNRTLLNHATTPAEAENLNIHEVRDLVNWCDSQRESYWDSCCRHPLTLQQILSLYHAVAEADYYDLDTWFDADHAASRAAWDRIVGGIE